VVGAYPRAVLGEQSTLGYDALLAGDPDDQGPPTVRVGERSRIGVTTVVG